MKKLLFLVIVLYAFMTGCGSEKTDEGKLQVTASFYPMAEFVRQVGGDKVQVNTMVPDGAEAHDWEPSARDLVKLGKSRIFVYNGIVEPWAEQSLQALSERDIIPVEAGRGLYMRKGKKDPHVWVSPKKAAVEVQRITDALCSADAGNAAYYRKNSAAYLHKLEALDKQLENITAKAGKKVFVTAHAAFGHLADDYGLTQMAIRGLSPEAEPTAAELQQIISVMRRENVDYIFFETLTDPKIAEVLAKEAGAKTAVLDPLEGLGEEGRRQGLDYIKIMQKNIENLKTALDVR